MKANKPDALRIAVVSSNEVDWGGSEELWQQAALAMAGQGHRVQIFKPRLQRGLRPVRELRDAGCKLTDLTRPFGLPELFVQRVGAVSRLLQFALLAANLLPRLLWNRPDFVLLSQGGNWDGAHFAKVLRLVGSRYAIVSQKASEFYWPPDSYRPSVTAMYRDAIHAFFVSEHNRQLTELQLGEALPPASVARNPFLVDFAAPLAWPEHCDESVDFACIGRLYPMEKGQDLILRVLAMPKWKTRGAKASFYGEGINRAGLEAMAVHLGLGDRVRFCGQVEDVAGIWCEHQVLLLASRCEGLPLVVVEAMLAGRVVIATAAGGSGEAFDDGVTGFLAQHASVEALDDAMERAWNRRAEWRQIGCVAAQHIRRIVPADPGSALAKQIVALASRQTDKTQE